MNKKKTIQYDRVTEWISGLLGKIPRAGKHLQALYLWKPLMFNYMLVGASGTVLSWVLYEGVFRIILVSLWGGTFLGMVITTVLVYLWNFTWNKHWSLKPSAQVMKMNRTDLMELRERIDGLLKSRFDAEGKRL